MVPREDNTTELSRSLGENIAQIVGERPRGAFMFTDLENSTKLCARMGDDLYRQTVQKPYLDGVREEIERSGGIYIKNVGDSVLAFFPGKPDGALDAAVRSQRWVMDNLKDREGNRVRQRIALHWGDAVLATDVGYDLAGNALNLTARVLSIAHPDQILLTDEMARQLPTRVERDLFRWGKYAALGIQDEFILDEFLWDKSLPRVEPIGQKCRPVGILNPYIDEFVGRGEETKAVLSLLKEGRRAVVLHGIGGMGKTRLAYHICRTLFHEGYFSDGILFVRLADVPATLPDWYSAFLKELGLEATMPEREVEKAVFGRIGRSEMLIALDNLETEPDASDGRKFVFSSFIDKLLDKCVNLTVLGTSQCVPPVDRWQVVNIGGMPVPDERGEGLEAMESFRLFETTARRRAPSWKLDKGNRGDTARILRALGGMPLAVESLATWVDRRTMRELREGLDGSIELVRRSGMANIPSRHMSLDASLEYSCQLLDDRTVGELKKLGVFELTFDSQAAAAVAKVGRSTLDTLVDRSFLTFDPRAGRYRFQQPVWQFLRDRLEKDGEAAASLREAHSRYYTELPTECKKLMERPDGDRLADIREARAKARPDYSNIEAALRWALAKKDRRFARAAYDLGEFYQRDGLFDKCLALYKAAEELERDNTSQCHALALQNLGTAYWMLQTGVRRENLAKAKECFEGALKVWSESDTPVQWANALANLGAVYTVMPTGDRMANLHKAIECFEATLRVRTEKDRPLEFGKTMNNLGSVYLTTPDDTEENIHKAVECLQAALRVRTPHDQPVEWFKTVSNLGVAYAKMHTGDRSANLTRAIEWFEKALGIVNEFEHAQHWGSSVHNLGLVYSSLLTGDTDENLRKAIGYFEAALRVRSQKENPMYWAMTMSSMAEAYMRITSGDKKASMLKGVEYYEASLRVFTERETPLPWSDTCYNLGKALILIWELDKDPGRLRYARTMFEQSIRGALACGVTTQADRAREQIEYLDSLEKGGKGE